jgi:hypothetical protein
MGTRLGKSELRLAPLLAAALLLSVAGCAEKKSADPSVDPFAASPHDQPDPLREAHQRGWLWAQRSDAKLVSDCGALADADERFGCATYVNNLSD